MARIRTVKPEFWQDYRMAEELTRDQRLLYIALWNEADDEGRFLAHPRRLLGIVFPYDRDITEEWMKGALLTLADTGRLILYEVGSEPYGQLTKFKNHQRINKPSESKLPSPTTDSAVITEPSGNGGGNVREASPRAREEVEGEVEGDQGSGSTPPDPPAADASDDAGQAPEGVRLEYTDQQLLDAADETLGLGRLDLRGKVANRDIVNGWLYSSDHKRSRGMIWAAIHGAAMLRDDGSTWLEKGKPYDVRCLVKAGALRDQGDGKSVALLWDLATDRYYADPPSPSTAKRSRDGLTKLSVELESA